MRLIARFLALALVLGMGLLLIPGPARIVSGAVSTATPTGIPPQAESLPTLCARAVERMVALTHDLENPYLGEDKNPARVSGDFDVNAYFAVLKRLSLPPNVALDYVYFKEFLGGEPILYTRPASDPRFETYDALAKSRKLASPWDADEAYLDDIVVTDSEAGFLEFTILRIMGDQFYLYWHALYDDTFILCDPVSLENLVASYTGAESASRGPLANFGVPFSDEIAQAARELDTTPIVTLNDDQVTVSLLTFTNWGGFIRREYTFSRTFPHKLHEAKTRALVRYECGVVF